MYAAASATLPGVCRDARYLAGKNPGSRQPREAAASASRTGAVQCHRQRALNPPLRRHPESHPVIGYEGNTAP